MTPPGQSIRFTALPITLPCPVRVTPDGRAWDENDEPLPDEERTEFCAVDAHWMIGAVISCDVHTAFACRMLGIDFDELALEAGRELEDARRPWAERRRYSQEQAADTARTQAAQAERLG